MNVYQIDFSLYKPISTLSKRQEGEGERGRGVGRPARGGGWRGRVEPK